MPAKKTKVPDLGAISPTKACEKPHEFELRHPVQGPLGVFISVLGSESALYKRTFRAKIIESQRLGRDLKEGEELAPAVEERLNADLFAAITTGWRSGDEPFVVHEGKELECTRDNAASLYLAEGWIADQVETQARTLGNFMTA